MNTIGTFDRMVSENFHTPGELEQIEKAKRTADAPTQCSRYHLEWETPTETGDLALVRAIFFHDGKRYEWDHGR